MKLDRFRKSAESPLLPLTAMIDVLFLMIIFLVLGANFNEVESVRLPEASGGREATSARLSLELHANGSLMLEHRTLTLSQALAEIVLRSPPAVLVLPDREASVGALFRLVERLRGALSVPVRVGVRPAP